MKIVHLCLSCFYVEGMGYQENILPRKHKQLGYDVSIIASRFTFDSSGKPYFRPVDTHINEDGIPVTVLDYQNSIFNLARYLHYFKGLYKCLTNIKPDVIFCHGVSFFSIFELKKYCKENSVKLFCDCHSDYYNTPTTGFKYGLINGLFWPMVARRIVPYIEKAWGTTPARCEYLRTVYKFPASKVDLLVMGGDEERIPFDKRDEVRQNFSYSHAIPNDSFIICSGGKINKTKNIIELIRAFKQLNDSSLYLVLFGSVTPDIKQEYDQLVSECKNIINIGWANQKEINEILVLSDLAIFPGTHSVLWEQSIACGTPTIYRKREMMMHVDVGGNCLFIEDGSEDSIKQVLLSVINDHDLYNRMKKVTETKGRKAFSYRYIAQRSIGEQI